MEVSFKLEVFEGPLDLLLHLIDKNKINIYDIPIAEITDQYMEYLDQMEKADLNVMSEFLLMAATLLDIKSRMLLPKEVNEDGEEEDPREELVERLLNYKMYKSMAVELRDKEVETGQSAYRKMDLPEEVAKYVPPVDMDSLLADVDLQKLNDVFNEVLKRSKEKIDPIRSKFGKIEQEEISLEDKILWMSAYADHHQSFSFRHILELQKNRTHMIVAFQAVLELIKTGKIRVQQESIEDDILITTVLKETGLGDQ